MDSLSGKTVAVCVSGGIAAYKACVLVSLLKKAGADVQVVMTKNATEFVAPLTFETLSKNRVICDMFDRSFEYEVGHISLAKKADLFVIAPCTANIIGKIASGIADDFLTTTVMAAVCPVIICPAMNTNMYDSAACKDNLRLLEKRGFSILAPSSGKLACGDEGAGRLPEPETIYEKIKELLLKPRDYDGKTVLITAGATEEPIDPVRFITNRSSGKTGLFLARAAAARGAKVILVAGRVSTDLSGNFETVRVKTTEEMRNAVMDRLAECNLVIKAAAPADYRVKNYSADKLKSKELCLEMQKNCDIAAEAGRNKGAAKLVIFAAETENLIQNAKEKLKKKNADMVVANDVTKEGAGFDCDTNIITIIKKDGSVKPVEKSEKSVLADIILDEALKI